jgi:hypothetical protein
MGQIKRTIQKQAWRAANRYARSRRPHHQTLRRIGPLLDVWFAIVDRVR